MAFAIMGGLLVASILTLVFFPTVYVTWFGGHEPAPTTPSAEPAETVLKSVLQTTGKTVRGPPPSTTAAATPP